MSFTMDFDAPTPVKSPLGLVQLIPPLAKAKEVLFTVDGEYIFDVATTASAVAVSASNHQIKIYDAQLSLQGCLTGHTNTISAIQFHPNDANLLFSAAQDGKTHCWDLRAPAAPVSTWSAPNRHSLLSLSLSPSASLLATGTELVSDGAFIHFYDLRAPALQHSFTESLADDVTQLAFHPTVGNRLLSGSTDGIACVFDLNTWDEDEDLVGSMQSGSSVHKLGWFGPTGEYVWMTTHTETVMLWSGEGDLVKDFGDVRQYSSEEVPINYAVGFKYDEASQRLYLVTGSHEGALSILHVTMNELQLCFSAGHAHSDVIRPFPWILRLGRSSPVEKIHA
ncbi:WD40-repeat-containing domain protein [Catenaria anguillulae PL171]|uniref:WD40-repeat-containing domain protein n=1 Tax=Catenaria anguillulae PL171 TaxID=765915 RepID=A0A1Y2HAR7_9FUNG|nr:WD40-repeat-containing domain protein [Catenaria anguillulae PL171]